MVDRLRECPEGAVLIASGGKVYPDEPAFCIDVSKITQEKDNAFWIERQQSGFDLKSLPQPKGDLAGPAKPAVLRTWGQAMDYCKAKGGHLPTQQQLEKAKDLLKDGETETKKIWEWAADYLTKVSRGARYWDGIFEKRPDNLVK